MPEMAAHDVICRWLSGVESCVFQCVTVSDVKIRASALTHHLATDIEILSVDPCLCLSDEAPAPDGICIVIIKDRPYDTALSLEALKMHALHSDNDGIERCIWTFDKHYLSACGISNASGSSRCTTMSGIETLTSDELIWKACEMTLLLRGEQALELFQIFYRYLQDVNRQDNCQMTLLHKALNIRWAEVVSLLLFDPRVKVEVAGPGLRTALHTCARQGHIDWMKKIVQRCAGDHTMEEVAAFVNFQDRAGNTALHDGVSKRCDYVVDFLLSVPGINVNARTGIGWTPLAIASTDNSIMVAKFLKRHDVNLNAKDNEGRSALHVAVRRGKTSIAIQLIRAGISVNAVDNSQATPIYDASINGHLDILDQLVAVEGINVNSRFADGRTPLMKAAFLRLELVIDRLLSVDSIDVNLRDHAGNTAVMLASNRGCIALAQKIADRAH